MRTISRYISLCGVAVALLVSAQAALAFYNPNTGRWLSRDPIEERGGNSLFAFVLNTPINAYDLLGKIVRGGEMQMHCRQPCEDYRRRESASDRKVPNGGIVCCGGAKFICTWGADKEKNAKAKEIAQRCIREHERIHLPSTECDSCSMGPVKPRYTKQDKASCEEEVAGYTAGKACFEAARSECGNDPDCIKSIEEWIRHEDEMRRNMEAWCKRFDWRNK